MKESFVVELNVTAPLFKLLDIYDREIDLTKYKGKKVFIGFFRHTGCPFCNLRVHNLLKKYEEYKSRNMEMIFFFESKKDVILRSTFHREISPIPIIADPEKNWYKIYGIENSVLKSTASHLTSFIQTALTAKFKNLPMGLVSGNESYSTMPAEFLIDENLIIRKIHYSNSLNDRLSFTDIENFIAK